MQVIRTIAATIILAASLLAADDSFIGTWKLNLEKSKFGPGMKLKSLTLTFKNDGPAVRRIAQGMDGRGKPIDQGGPEGSASVWDGKDHKVSGEVGPEVFLLATPVVNGATDVVVRMQGKVISRVHAVVSKDGKTLTETHHDVNEKGLVIKSVMVFDRQ